MNELSIDKEAAGIDRTAVIAWSLSCIMFILYGLGILYPTIFTWGFHAFGFLPAYTFPLACILAVGTAFALWKDGGNRFRKVLDILSHHQRSSTITLFLTLIALSVLLRVRAPLLGDGFFLVKNFSDAFRGQAPVYFRDEPLSTGFFWVVFRLFGPPTTFHGFLLGYLLGELFLEAGFFIFTVMTIRLLTTEPKAQLLGTLTILGLPYVQLFFGYIETYSVQLFCISLYVYVAVLNLRERIPFWILPPCYLLLFLSHYSTAFLFPSLVYLAYNELRSRGWKDVVLGFGLGGGIFLFILFLINFDIDPYTTSVPHHHYLSLTPAQTAADADTEAYTMLSPYHIFDLANYLILMGTPFLFTLFLLRLSHRWREFLWEKKRLFFVIAFLPVVCLLALIKFDLGAIRDWDMFAPYFYFLPFFLVLHTFENADDRTIRVSAFVVVLLIIHSCSYWLVNAGAQSMLRRISVVFDQRTLSHGAYYTASLNLAQYYHQTGEDQKALDVWLHYRKVYPSDLRSYENLIYNYQKLPAADDSAVDNVFADWLRAAPTDTLIRKICRNHFVDRGNSSFQNGDLTRASRFFEEALRIDTSYATALNNLGSVYAQQGNSVAARDYFSRALHQNPQYGDALYNLGSLLLDQGNTKEAVPYLRQAAALHISDAVALLDSLERAAGRPRKRGSP